MELGERVGALAARLRHELYRECEYKMTDRLARSEP